MLAVGGAEVFAWTGNGAFDPDGPVLFFVHGAGMNHAVWNRQAEDLARLGYSIVAVDLPGHGRSGGAPLEDIPEMGMWVIDVLDQLDIERGALVGHSMGSLVALEAAARAPGRNSHLALLGTGVSIPVNPDLLRTVEFDEPGVRELMASWSFRKPDGSEPPGQQRLREQSVSIFSAQAPGVLAVDVRAVDDYQSAEPAARTCNSPTLVVIGEHDRMTPPAGARDLAAIMGDAMVLELDAGHMTMMESPDEVTRALASFVAQ